MHFKIISFIPNYLEPPTYMYNIPLPHSINVSLYIYVIYITYIYIQVKAQEASPRKPMCFVALVEQAGLKRLCYLYSFYMVYERWLPIVGTMPYNKYIYIYIYMCVCVFSAVCCFMVQSFLLRSNCGLPSQSSSGTMHAQSVCASNECL
jgi:hypothetical protein